MTDPCVHRWVIASPEGRTSLGQCRICKATKVFQNSEPQATMAERLNRMAIERQRITAAATRISQSIRTEEE